MQGQKAGVSAALLEVCFLDDPDDMAVYTAKFRQIVEGIAEAVREGFGLRKEAEEEVTVYKNLADVPAWGQATVRKLLDKGYLEGTGDGLNLEHNMLRVLVINDRAGLYG